MLSYFLRLIQVLLQVLLFRPPVPTSQQVTSKALKAYRTLILQGSSATPDIPSELSFDHVLSAQAGHPISRSDFLMYLTNETYTQENLQFLLFVLSYTQLYTTLAAQGAIRLSPGFTEQDEKDARRAVMTARRASRTTSVISNSPPPTSHSNYTEFGVFTGCSSISSRTPPTTAGGDHEPSTPSTTNAQLSDEIEKCLATYIRPHSPRELNLSDLDRALLLQSLQQSNHPDVFRLITKQLEPLVRASYLDFVSHIVRSPACPANLFASRLIGPVLIVSSLLATTFFTISKVRRELRSLLVPVLFCGVATSFCVERKAFVWCGEEVDELLEEGGVGGKGKRKVRGVVVAQGVWAGVLAAGVFCVLFLLVPSCNKF
jgi:hypothetical protein